MLVLVWCQFWLLFALTFHVPRENDECTEDSQCHERGEYARAEVEVQSLAEPPGDGSGGARGEAGEHGWAITYVRAERERSEVGENHRKDRPPVRSVDGP